ncbi:Cache 3/Cache 2 fusion domain-containing protein, partial [Coralloluteibacterium stylophorae]
MSLLQSTRWSISAKQSLAIAVAICVVFAALAFGVARHVEGVTADKAQAQLRSALEVADASVARFHDSLLADTERLGQAFVAALPEGEAALEAPRPVRGRGAADAGADPVPVLTFGGEPLDGEGALVDRFTESTGSIATVFAREGEDFRRVATSLRREDGERATGTVLDHAHPAYARMLAGEGYTGTATLFGTLYMTRYVPLRDAAGEVVGIAFVGTPYAASLEALKASLAGVRIGDSGFLLALTRGAAPAIEVHPGLRGQPASALGEAATALLAADPQAGGIVAVDGVGRDGAVHAQRALVADPAGSGWRLAAVMDESEILAAGQSVARVIAVAAVAATLLLAALVYLLAQRMVRRPLDRAIGAVERVAAGALDTRMPAAGSNEMLRLNAAIQRMIDAIRERIEAEAEAAVAGDNLRIRQALDNVTGSVMIADADRRIVYANASVQALLRNAESDLRRDLPAFDASRLIGGSIDDFHRRPEHQARLLAELTGTHSARIVVGGRTMTLVVNPIVSPEGERVGTVVEWNDRTAEVAVEDEVARIVAAAQRGDLDARIDLAGKQGFLLQLSEGMNRVLDTTRDGVGAVQDMLAAMAEGDLTRRIDRELPGTFGRMRDDANRTAAHLAEIVRGIQVTAGTIRDASGEIASGNQDLSGRTEEQAASLEETASSMEELTSTVRQNAENARQANQLAQGAGEVAVSGGRVVEEVVTTMGAISES